MALKYIVPVILMMAAATILVVAAPEEQAAAPSTQPQPDAPATVSPEAQAQLDQIRQAYADVRSLKMSGKLSFDIKAAGQSSHQESTFTSSYESPNKFRHEMQDDVLVGSNAENVFIYFPAEKTYVQKETPEKLRIGDLPGKLPQVLQQQNLSQALVLSDDAAKSLTAGAHQVTVGPAVTVDGRDYHVLKLAMPDADFDVLIDPQTHLIHQVNADLRKHLEQKGVPDIEHARTTLVYDDVKLNEAIPGEQFAWSPPADAKPFVAPELDAEMFPALTLEGKPAPDFSLPGLDDQNVRLSDLKGSVVVIDFWATWCVPCKVTLPGLSKFYEEYQPKDVKVFAIDVPPDTKVKVQKFVNDLGLKMPILIDADGKVAKEYKQTALPTAYVIGKDGVVKKVVMPIGADPIKDYEEGIRTAVDKALAE